MPGFKLVVQKAWNEASTQPGPCQLLFHKLKKTSQRLRAWSKTIFSNTSAAAHGSWGHPLLRYGPTKKKECFYMDERDLKKRLERRVLGLAIFKSACNGQCFRIINLKKGDANTKHFDLWINHRSRRKSIHRSSMALGGLLSMSTRRLLSRGMSQPSWKKGCLGKTI